MREFTFEVVTSSTVSVAAQDGRQARLAVEANLDGVTAEIGAGPGVGTELRALRLLGSARLTSVDGIDPVAALERALRLGRDAPGDG